MLKIFLVLLGMIAVVFILFFVAISKSDRDISRKQDREYIKAKNERKSNNDK